MESKTRKFNEDFTTSSLLAGKQVTIKIKNDGRPISAVHKRIDLSKGPGAKFRGSFKKE
jgi:hypothetical protein